MPEPISPTTPAMPHPRLRILFVIGLGRSGSTLLGRLLNNHPAVADVGELLRLEYTLDQPDSKCACGLPLGECPDWNRMLEGIPDKVKRDYRKWTPELLHRMRADAGAEVLVDVSKTRGYRLAKRWRDPEVGFVLLLRDPRGILRSHVALDKDLTTQLKLHKKWIKRYESFAARRRDRCHVMHYEDLVTAPEAAMRSLCGFIGIDFRPEMTVPGAQTCHMALYSASPYLKGASELRLDERWRQEMPPAVIARISKALAPVRVYQERYRLADDA